MKNAFEKVVEAYRAMDIPVEVELIGERPCSGTPDPEKMRALEETASAVIRTYGGMTLASGLVRPTATSRFRWTSPPSAPASSPAAKPIPGRNLSTGTALALG